MTTIAKALGVSRYTAYRACGVIPGRYLKAAAWYRSYGVL